MFKSWQNKDGRENYEKDSIILEEIDLEKGGNLDNIESNPLLDNGVSNPNSDLETPIQNLDELNHNRDLHLETKSRSPTCKLKCTIGFLFVTTLLFLILWLSESQFSQGTLRLRYEDEECGYFLFGSKNCAPGLACIAKTCQRPTLPTDTQNEMMSCVNGTLVPSRCPVCPIRLPCPPVRPKLVTYFDFNEMPNHWLDPGTHGYFKTAHHISYGACKELCARDSQCQALNYQGFAEMCCLMDKLYYPAASLNGTWNSAIKLK